MILDDLIAMLRTQAEKTNARLTTGTDERGAIALQLANGTVTFLPAPPLRAEAKLLDAVTSAVYGLASLANQFQLIDRDTLLSQFGKEAKLRPWREGAIKLVAEAGTTVTDFATATDKAEAKRYAPPATPDQFRSVLRAFEIRQHVATLDLAGQLKLVEAAIDDEARELLAAVLDAPVGVMAEVREHATRQWQAAVNRADPAGLIAIQDARAGIEWAEVALAHVAGRTQQIARFPREQLAQLTYSSRGYRVFGISDAEAALAARADEFAKRRAAQAA
ncbi:MAG: hypothetical protein JNM50_04040 [Chromatiales bacterium]|nr:hypothetical protein [Chromatiales bacterium]